MEKAKVKALKAVWQNGKTSLVDKKSEIISEYSVKDKEFIVRARGRNGKSLQDVTVGVQECQVVDKTEESYNQADSLDGIINALEKGLKSGRNLAKLKIKPFSINDTTLGLTAEDREIIKGKMKFKKSLERFDKVIKKSEQFNRVSNNNDQIFNFSSSLSERVKIKKDRDLEDYSNLLEKLANGFKKLYTAIDRFVVIPSVTSKEWSGFVKEVLHNKNLLSEINFIRHELLSLFVCHGFIIEHAGKRRLSGYAKVLLDNKDFNPCKGKIFEKYPLMDIRNPYFYNGSWLKKNSFLKSAIKKYYGVSMAEFKKRYLEKKGSLIR